MAVKLVELVGVAQRYINLCDVPLDHVDCCVQLLQAPGVELGDVEGEIEAL
ncbi:hypothetical protein [Halochromatium roseum]|uniref:hypothetical protein n=1 Tax=Halochromatium roseum TaxID=391920 RepID=UPI0019113696|nr:hypothetical protein [Halochromatium roseum]